MHMEPRGALVWIVRVTAMHGDSPVAMPLRTRIAPSPTGRMHAGNVFAALASWLIGRKSAGEVVLRIEDLDRGRSRPRFIDAIRSDLDWLGFDFDGETVYQSRRADIYRSALDVLDGQGLLYPCFCSRADLHAASAPHTADGDLVYPGTCRDLSAEEQSAHRAKGQAGALRLRVPDAGDPAGIVSFHDVLQGQVTCELGLACGDFIVRRSDGEFAYQLAVVVDDLLQDVNCIVRGYDLLPSTPPQLYLRHLLEESDFAACEEKAGITAPEALSFYHVPLFVGADGRRLSKRNHDCGMDVLREAYGTPEALLGHIAHASGLIEGPETPMGLSEILERFDLDALKLRMAVEYR